MVYIDISSPNIGLEFELFNITHLIKVAGLLERLQKDQHKPELDQEIARIKKEIGLAHIQGYQQISNSNQTNSLSNSNQTNSSGIISWIKKEIKKFPPRIACYFSNTLTLSQTIKEPVRPGDLSQFLLNIQEINQANSNCLEFLVSPLTQFNENQNIDTSNLQVQLFPSEKTQHVKMAPGILTNPSERWAVAFGLLIILFLPLILTGNISEETALLWPCE